MIPVSPMALAISLLLVASLLGIAVYAACVLWQAARIRPLGLGAPSVQRTRPRRPSNGEVILSVLDQLEDTDMSSADVALDDVEIKIERSERGGWWLTLGSVSSYHHDSADLIPALQLRLRQHAASREIVAAMGVRRRLP